jgi:hypothetical protein
MTLILTIHDKHGAELNFGDIVKIETHSCGNFYTFYSEVTYLPDVQSIAPFHTFAFHYVEKVDRLPDGAKQMDETRYKCWMVFHDEIEDQPNREAYSKYLTEWRECEHLLSEKIFRVHISNEQLQPGTQLTLI